MDIALHPRFAENRLVYFTYPPSLSRTAKAHQRSRAAAWSAARSPRSAICSVPDAFDGNSGLNGRVVFGRDGMVYMSTGGNIGKVAQDPASLRGKILRLRDDGSVPPDDPFVGPRWLPAGNLSAWGIATRWP